MQTIQTQARNLRTRIVALGRDLAWYEAQGDRQAVQAAKYALAKAEAELTALFIVEG